MRLPEYLTRLSPVGETLAAMEAGEEALAAEVAERNAQLAVSTADTGRRTTACPSGRGEIFRTAGPPFWRPWPGAVP